MASLRLFVALPMPEACKDLLAGFLSGPAKGLASRITWTRPGNWHATLKFLGYVPEEGLGEIRTALAGVSFESFAFKPGGGGFFPNAKRPRVAWVGLKRGGPECAALAVRVDEALAGAGFEPEQRPFKPHLTVSRIRRDKRDDWPNLAAQLTAVPWPESKAESFVLYKSDLTPKGPVYTALGRWGM